MNSITRQTKSLNNYLDWWKKKQSEFQAQDPIDCFYPKLRKKVNELNEDRCRLGTEEANRIGLKTSDRAVEIFKASQFLEIFNGQKESFQSDIVKNCLDMAIREEAL